MRSGAIGTATVCFGLLGLGLAGCGSDVSEVDALSDMATKQGIPRYEDAAVAARSLVETVEVVCSNSVPEIDDVHAARSVWYDVRLSLAELEAFRHGPAMDERDQGRINTPVEPEAIEVLVDSLDPSIFDAHYVSTSIGATKRGLYAVEYVLFADGLYEQGTGGPATETIELLSDVDRCTYLEAISGAIAENIDRTLVGWTTGGEIKLPYTTALEVEKNAQDNINVVVETSVFLLRKIINMELAPALGLVGTEAELSGLGEGPAGRGLPFLAARLHSVQVSLVGDTGISALLSNELVKRLDLELEAAISAVEKLQTGGDFVVQPLRDAVIDDSEAMIEIHDLIATIERTVSTEVVGELGVVVGFSDADGDSAN